MPTKSFEIQTFDAPGFHPDSAAGAENTEPYNSARHVYIATHRSQLGVSVVRGALTDAEVSAITELQIGGNTAEDAEHADTPSIERVTQGELEDRLGSVSSKPFWQLVVSASQMRTPLDTVSWMSSDIMMSFDEVNDENRVFGITDSGKNAFDSVEYDSLEGFTIIAATRPAALGAEALSSNAYVYGKGAMRIEPGDLIVVRQGDGATTEQAKYALAAVDGEQPIEDATVGIALDHIARRTSYYTEDEVRQTPYGWFGRYVEAQVGGRLLNTLG